jgi:hypothetical protein
MCNAQMWTASWFADGTGEVQFDYDPIVAEYNDESQGNSIAAVAEYAGGLFVGGFFRTFDSGTPVNSLIWLADPSSGLSWNSTATANSLLNTDSNSMLICCLAVSITCV